MAAPISSPTPVTAPARPAAVGPAEPGGRAFSEVLAEQRLGGSPAEPASGAGEVARVFDRIEAGRKRLDAIIDQARGGKVFRPGELLALQAEVHCIGEELALSHRLVEQGAAGVRRLWSMQV